MDMVCDPGVLVKNANTSVSANVRSNLNAAHKSAEGAVRQIRKVFHPKPGTSMGQLIAGT